MEFESTIPGARDHLDYGSIPSESEFFAKITQREQTIKALRENSNGGRDSYRTNLIARLNRQSPFENYLMKVWARVQSAGWASGEKFRLMALFKTADDWKIAFLLAKATFQKKEREAVHKAYAEEGTGLEGYVDQNLDAIGAQGAGGIGAALRGLNG